MVEGRYVYPIFSIKVKSLYIYINQSYKKGKAFPVVLEAEIPLIVVGAVDSLCRKEPFSEGTNRISGLNPVRCASNVGSQNQWTGGTSFGELF